MRMDISVTVNAEPWLLTVESSDALLETLRSKVGVKSPKIGCERGDCGSCTVLLDGHTVRSCLVLSVEADGHEIVTIEGLTDEGLTELQQFFVDMNSFQCGFCAPGIVLAAAELLEEKPEPTRARCSGSDRRESVQVHGIRSDHRCRPGGSRKRREGNPMTTLKPFEEKSTRELDFVGKSTVRIDGVEKVSGAARYVDDMDFGPDLLHAEIVESPYANARIKGIDTSAAEAVPGVTKVVTGKDFPFKFGLYMKDRYVFAQDRVRFVGEQVAAVIARDPKVAKRAAKLVKVDYEELTPIFDPIEALKPDTGLIHPDLGDYPHVPWFYPHDDTNIAHWRKTRKGDVEQGFAEADLVLEGEYTVPRYAHCAIEPHVIVGLYDQSGRLTMWSASQSPYTQRHLFAEALAPLGLTHQNVRVITPYVGGGFGGKAGVSMEIMGAAIATAVKGHPVKIRFTREQEFYNTYHRQGMVAHIKMGVKNDGTITAIKHIMNWGRGRLRGVWRQCGQRGRVVGDGPLSCAKCLDRLQMHLHQPSAGRALPGFRLLGVHVRTRVTRRSCRRGDRNGCGRVPAEERHCRG